MSEPTFTCSRCGGIVPVAERQIFDERDFCPACLEEETLVCDHCGTRMWAHQNVGDAYIHLCGRCYDRHYTSCEQCGRIIHQDDTCYGSDDDYPYCPSCHLEREAEHNGINDYYYKPAPIFYGNGTRYFGVELEIDGAGECGANARQVLGVANTDEEKIYCKHDGSLDDGFEIVTHPMTLDYHSTHMPWPEVMDKALELGYRSHKARTCGLHAHVNRTAFGDTIELQEAAIARVLYFFEKHWEELLKFSRRTESQLKRWAARYGYKEQPKDILDHAKSGYGGRYTCINLTNQDTVEFRIFRGTLKYNTLIATLQLIDKICDVAVFLSDDEVKGLSWTSFVVSVDAEKYPELVQYLKERRLYVNETVDAEEDD